MSTSRADVVALLQGSDAVEFSGSVARQLMGPIVYVLFRSDQVLYVGMSRHGIGRFSLLHQALTRIESADKLQCFPMPDRASARALEALLILQLQPEWNKQGRTDYRAIASRLGVAASSARRLTARAGTRR